MAKILLNTRASRITIVDNITLLPAEVRKDERFGKVIKPSRTLISEQGKPSPYERVTGDPGCAKLFQAQVLEWSNDEVDEPEKIPNTKGASPYPRMDGSDKDVKKISGSDAADVDHRALIDDTGTPLAAIAAQEKSDARVRGDESSEAGKARRAAVENEKSSEAERAERAGFAARVKTDEAVDQVSASVGAERAETGHGSHGRHSKAGGKGG